MHTCCSKHFVPFHTPPYNPGFTTSLLFFTLTLVSGASTFSRTAGVGLPHICMYQTMHFGPGTARKCNRPRFFGSPLMHSIQLVSCTSGTVILVVSMVLVVVVVFVVLVVLVECYALMVSGRGKAGYICK